MKKLRRHEGSYLSRRITCAFLGSPLANLRLLATPKAFPAQNPVCSRALARTAAYFEGRIGGDRHKGERERPPAVAPHVAALTKPVQGRTTTARTTTTAHGERR
ncbi:hypothetical protein KM043_005665 [Ampulex compressa]|nr:hypothetical protein KM043_005665 [Ampulex compressa]